MKMTHFLSGRRIWGALTAMGRRLFLMLPISAAHHIYVSDAGADIPGAGSRRSPCKTFRYALEQARNGDTIHFTGTVTSTQLGDEEMFVFPKSVIVTSVE